MGALLARGIQEFGNWIGGEIGGKTGDVFKNVFQYWANGIRVVDDIMSIATLGTLGAAEQGIATAAKISLSGAAGASGLVPDLIRAGSGLVRFVQDPAREDSINSWYNDKVDPYFTTTPFGTGGTWNSVLAGFQPMWLSPALHGLETKTRHGTDLALAHMRRAHDLQVRAAGDILGINQLMNIRDQGRRVNNAMYIRKSQFYHRVKATAEELASAREIWERAKPAERQRIETSVNKDLIDERKLIAMEEARERMVFKRDPSARIVGPGFIAPSSNVLNRQLPNF